MARIRTIKPELLEDGKVARLPHLAWRLFVSLILLSDDYGNLRGDPERIHGAALWAHPREDSRNPREDFRTALDTLLAAELVIAYEVRGQQYIHIAGWEKHQKVDHPGKPLCPALTEGSRLSREALARIPEPLAPDHDPDLDLDQDPDPRAGAPAGARSNDDAGVVDPEVEPPPPAALTPVDPEQRRWPAEEWFEAFRISWLTYQKGSYGGRPNDFTAITKLRAILANLPLDEALAAQKRSGQMFAEYFGDRSEQVAKARHPWSWFVQRFDGLRFPEKTGPKDDRCAFHRRGFRGMLPREGAHDTCPECRYAKARQGGRTGEPTTAGDALVAATEKKAAELRKAAEKTWTPEQLAEMRETLQRDRAQPKAAAS